MRLPPQVSAVLRTTNGRPVRAGNARGLSPAKVCEAPLVACACSNGEEACCQQGEACHLDSNNVCVCGLG